MRAKIGATVLACTLGVACGEAPLGSPQTPDGLAAIAKAGHALVATPWQGFQLRRSSDASGLALASKPVRVNFAANQGFSLQALSERNAKPTRGQYELTAETMVLHVVEKAADDLALGRQEFHYNLNAERLHLYNDTTEFTLLPLATDSDDTTDSDDATAPSSGESGTVETNTDLFDSWVCQSGSIWWRLALDRKLTFVRRAYPVGDYSDSLVNTIGTITSYTTSPVHQARLKLPKPEDSLYIDLRRQTSKDRAYASVYKDGETPELQYTLACRRL